MAALAAEGEYDSAVAEIESALAEEEAAHKRRQSRLLDSGIELALLDGDAARAAALILRKADHDAGGRADSAALRQVQENYYVAGRDKGVALDLRVSIALAKLLVDRAGDSDETGAALNILGTALATLGERDSGTHRLEQAVEAYQQALKERTRDRVPLDWAATQNNLGTALQTLGERDRDTDRLEQAVKAYQPALKEHTRDRVPLDWAATQYNLGDALQALGERDSGTDRLEQAVEAYQQALKEYTRDRVPLDWARIQHNLALTYLMLFEKTAQAAHLDRAQDLLSAAAAEFAAAGASHYADMAACLLAKLDAARSAG